jgi:hypothetical protein
MQAIASYHDLCKEIEVLELRAEGLEEEAKLIKRKINPLPIVKMVANYSGMPGAGMAFIQTDRLWRRMSEISEELVEIYDILELKCEYKKRMEERMQEFEGLEYKVAYLRDVKRLPLYEVAKELHLTYDWIRKVSARVPRMRIPA